ncbi:MAG: hypothetical protein HZA54_03260, partial [Planctomycetes bacterium]|nr:hypothetical protein [Planctomycetota bacterium]
MTHSSCPYRSRGPSVPTGAFLLVLALLTLTAGAAAPPASPFVALEEEFFAAGWNVGAHPRLDEQAEQQRWRARALALERAELPARATFDRDLLVWRLDALAAAAELDRAATTDPWVWLPRTERVERLLSAAGQQRAAAARLAGELDGMAERAAAGTDRLVSVRHDALDDLKRGIDGLVERVRTGVDA